MEWLVVAAVWALAVWCIVYQPVYRLGWWLYERKRARRDRPS